MNAKEFLSESQKVLKEAAAATDLRAVQVASKLLGGDAFPIYHRSQVISRWGGKNGTGLGLYLIPLVLVVLAISRVLSLTRFTLPRKKSCAVGIRTYPEDMGFVQPGRSVDFFMGDTPPGDVVFCAEGRLSLGRRREFQRRGYTLVEPLKTAYLGDLAGALGAWVRFVTFAHRMDRVTRQVSMDILLHYLIWTGFLSRYSVGEYRVYNDIVPTSIVRTILFRNAGIPVVWQVHSSNNWNQYDGGQGVIEPELVDVVADEILVWDDRMRDHFLRQTSHADRVEVTGCPWSRRVREIRSRVLVGVFDTSAGGRSPVSAEAMGRFMADIIRLATDGRFYVLYKPKLGIPMEKTILTHPGIRVMADTTETLLLSDAVVAIPFTSPGVEAAQAGIPVLWFDPSGTVSGYYPVIHSYDELVKRLIG